MNYLHNYLLDFSFTKGAVLFPDFENKTKLDYIPIKKQKIKKYVNEFWTAKQRQVAPIHEISYRACFKPQLPHFFINLLTEKGDIVYDPFSGRGTTVIEAGLMQRNVIANDINPLSKILTEPRFYIPKINDVEKRLKNIPIKKNINPDIDLSMFFHKKTLNEIFSIKHYLIERKIKNKEDYLDKWIRMIATNRLTGHSHGFFSVYTLPPNQAVSAESQIKINKKRNQKPVYRNTKEIILKKTANLINKLTLEEITNLKKAGKNALLISKDARNTLEIKSETVKLTVTSPPFLDIVQYSKDNWLRCWFNDIDANEIERNITVTKELETWCYVMQEVFYELFRITKRNGWVAFEVGEIRKGKIKLDEYVVPLGLKAGFNCYGIVINLQKFTKTSNIWGINNNNSGTNTNRIVLFQK